MKRDPRPYTIWHYARILSEKKRKEEVGEMESGVDCNAPYLVGLVLLGPRIVKPALL